jgi:valyl-tRNA synthetase
VPPPPPAHLLTTPVRLTGPLSLGQLAVLVTAAATPDVEWHPAVLAGDLAGQYAAERDLAREGRDRATLGRDEFIERVRTFEADRRKQATETFARLGVHVDLDAAVINRDDLTRAARTAFVQLYEAGLLHREELVVDTCPRCATVVDGPDAEPGELEGERLLVRLRFPDDDEPLDVPTLAPELLVGAVAVTVPADHPRAGGEVEIPLTGRTVPIAADSDPDADQPGFVVPAHDPVALETARRLSLFPVEVLDDFGEVTEPGPLHGLGRFAARAAARDLLIAEDALVGSEPAAEPVCRCRRCGTVLVPRLGMHWFLDMAVLEVAAADQLREGVLAVSPPAARDELLARAGAGGTWCLSHQVWAGSPVPVSTCWDCGQVAVAVDQPDSCGKCMGELVADDSVLDARFVGAIGPLAATGWPDARPDPDTVAATTLLCTPTGLFRWALPMAALGLRLAGCAPFARIEAVPLTASPDDPDPRLAADLDALIDERGADAVRAALLSGTLD